MRSCGECTACCRLLPVAELGKAAGGRCPHQRSRKGCAIHGQHPVSCKAWSCLWLSDPATKDLRRPDRSGYVLDSMPDFGRLRNEDTCVETSYEVVQIWAPERGITIESALFPYLEARRAGGVIRSSGPEVVVMIPPWASPIGKWTVQEAKTSEPQHTVDEVNDTLSRLKPTASRR